MTAWFPCQHPEEVRVAQSTVMARQSGSHAATVASMMALGLLAQLHAGFGWAAFTWQCAMVLLAGAALAAARRAGELPPSAAVSTLRIRKLTLFAGLFGLFWSAGFIAWVPVLSPEVAMMAVGVSAAYTLHAAAAWFFVPSAVLAFCIPLFAASLFVLLSTLQGSAAALAMALMALHAWAGLRLLTRNWTRFTQAIDSEIEKDLLAAMLREQKVIAEKAGQLKSRFLASASHDLRQPMHAIMLYLDGLSEVELPERARAAISDARLCAHDMIEMFRSVLDLSRLDAQQAVPALSVFGMGPVLARVEKDFLPLAASRGVRLKVRPCTDHVYSDPVMVERIALNFVSNAVRHTSGGRVLVACRVRGRSLRLAVYDTGKGIPESEQQAIFDEFRRLEASPQDHTGGLGLGLAIVKRLAQALRLPVTVRSTPGKGSMFAVDLPLTHVSRFRPPVEDTKSRLAGRLVVLVDDEPSILMAASFVLEGAGCEVISVRSGQEAFALLEGATRVPDIIICDYELGEKKKGLDVIRELREEFNRDIPAILVTGDTAEGDPGKTAMELGIPVLYKPLEAAALRSSLEELLTEES